MGEGYFWEGKKINNFHSPHYSPPIQKKGCLLLLLFDGGDGSGDRYR